MSIFTCVCMHVCMYAEICLEELLCVFVCAYAYVHNARLCVCACADMCPEKHLQLRKPFDLD